MLCRAVVPANADVSGWLYEVKVLLRNGQAHDLLFTMGEVNSLGLSRQGCFMAQVDHAGNVTALDGQAGAHAVCDWLTAKRPDFAVTAEVCSAALRLLAGETVDLGQNSSRSKPDEVQLWLDLASQQRQPEHAAVRAAQRHGLVLDRKQLESQFRSRKDCWWYSDVLGGQKWIFLVGGRYVVTVVDEGRGVVKTTLPTELSQEAAHRIVLAASLVR
jgi:hypothetical protein